MTRSLIIAGVVLVLAAGLIAGVLSDSSGTSADPSSPPAGLEATATATPAPTATPKPPTNRADCRQIRGTDYLSPQERQWFLANCVSR